MPASSSRSPTRSTTRGIRSPTPPPCPTRPAGCPGVSPGSSSGSTPQGSARFDVVTDHGFLWLNPEDVDALGTPAIPPAQVVEQDRPLRRCWRPAPPLPSSSACRCRSSLRLSSGFPRGIRTLVKAAWYAHGGISLQETIIPHVVSRAAATAVARVRASFTVPLVELVGATIPVRVSPLAASAEGEQLSLQAPPPVPVRLEVVAVGEDAPVQARRPSTSRFGADSPEQATALYLSEGVKLSAGTELRVRAFDDETGESLFEHPLRS